MKFGRKSKAVVIGPETVLTTIQRLETLTERIEATAAVLEKLIARLKAEDKEAEAREDGAHHHDE